MADTRLTLNVRSTVTSLDVGPRTLAPRPVIPYPSGAMYPSGLAYPLGTFYPASPLSTAIYPSVPGTLEVTPNTAVIDTAQSGTLTAATETARLEFA